MSFEAMKQRILAMPEVAAWPQMTTFIGRATHHPWRSLWDYPFIASRAVGGTDEAAIPGAGAIFCSLASVHLVDDMLDDDPNGDYHTLGIGNAANLALAFQAAGHRALDAAPGDELRATLQGNLARMALATAYGQNLDACGFRTEEEYWRTVQAKTPPLFSSAFYLGARLGGATEETAAQLERLGGMIGMFIQVSDDLADAVKSPPGADWQRRFNNLAILFALTADHPERERFEELSAHPEDAAGIAEAQKILLRSGAVSYCALKLIEFARATRELLASIDLHDAAAVEQLLAAHMRPLDQLFRSVGIDTPAVFLPD
ncbi:MAG: polyprenyl synthetase family protein [Acidobacteriota bacterium]